MSLEARLLALARAMGEDVKTLLALATSGGVIVNEVEVNFGYPPMRESTFIITDAAVTPASRILAQQSGAAPTGKNADDNEMEKFVCTARAGAGSFMLHCAVIEGIRLAGRYRVSYLKG